MRFTSFLLLSFLSLVIGIENNVFKLPEFSYLQFEDLEIMKKLSEQLTTIGAVQIIDIPKFSQARIDALGNVAECLSSIQEKAVLKRNMPDGSVRFTAAAKTVDGNREPMTNRCGESSSKLRSLVDQVAKIILSGLDKLHQTEDGKSLIMEPGYDSFTSIFMKGDHLEHIHSYFPSQSIVNTPTMDFHTDNGLMIAMTTGMIKNTVETETSGLFMMLPSGEKVKVEASDSSLILMMGEGAAKWLKPVLGRSFRAVPHSLNLNKLTGGSRSWYGKMYLPPSDAIIPDTKLSFKEYHYQESDPKTQSSVIPLACESGSFLPNAQCPENELMCWNQCVSVDSLPCGMDAQCINLETGETVPGDIFCLDPNYPGGSSCQLECVNSTSYKSSSSPLILTSSSEDDYCSGVGTSMSMTGFFSIVDSEKGTTPCINLWFDSWTLNNATKFAFACLGVLLLGIVMQYLPILGNRVKKYSQNPLYQRITEGGFFGLQMGVNYFLMFVAMTYSVELFCMVIVGISMGFALFHSEDRYGPDGEKRRGYKKLEDVVSVGFNTSSEKF